MHIDIFSFSEIFHVGNLNERRQRLDSYEGDTLSVSLTPAQWTKVAKLGQKNTYKICNESMINLIDMHAVKENRDLHGFLLKKLIQENYIQEANVYKYCYFDDDLDQEVEITYTSKEEASYELSELLDDGVTVEELVEEERTYQITEDKFEKLRPLHTPRQY